jgi:putative DNA primase/helicase
MDRAKQAKEAASKAAWILSQCQVDTHPYLAAKGFPKERGLVWSKHEPLLVIPMRAGNGIVGCQLIDKEGRKKFLRGQISKGASFEIGAGRTPVFCEGYATGLSLRDALSTSQVGYKIHVCFSAGNMEGVSLKVTGGFVVADHDLSGTGESAARKTGKPYWISPTASEDFNDFHRRVGLFQASQAIKKMMYVARG